MSNNYDVIVVGGRVAGASTAMLLARAGARVALVERSRHGSDTVSTHGLMRAGVMQLTRWGLLDKVVDAGTPAIRRTDFHYADGESVQVSIRPGAGVDALYAPRRHVLDRILVDAAAAEGTVVHYDTVVTELLRDRDGRVSGVRAQDRSGRSMDLRATITVGADGVRSTVAELVGSRVVRRGRSRSAVLYRYYGDAEATGYEWAYGAGGAAGFLPTNDLLTCVFVATTPSRMHALRHDGTEQAFGELLATSAPRLADRVAAARPAEPMHGWAGIAGFVRQSWGPGWALVGDAGYFKDPLTTHGMTDALRDAELLADEILEVLTGATPEAIALARYQGTRDRVSASLFEATERAASYEWDLDELRVVLRRVSSAMSDEVDLLQGRPERLSREKSDVLPTQPA
jgi:flavin-dependent dehydrogenase